MALVAEWMDRVLASPDDESVATRVKAEIRELCAKFPAPGISVAD